MVFLFLVDSYTKLRKYFEAERFESAQIVIWITEVAGNLAIFGIAIIHRLLGDSLLNNTQFPFTYLLKTLTFKINSFIKCFLGG